MVVIVERRPDIQYITGVYSHVLFTLEGHVVNPDIPGRVEAHRAQAAVSLTMFPHLPQILHQNPFLAMFHVRFRLIRHLLRLLFTISTNQNLYIYDDDSLAKADTCEYDFT